MAIKKTRIYVGPNLSRGRLMRYSTFIGGLPQNLSSEFEAMPELARLFVPVENLSRAVEEVNTKGTPLNKYYNLAKEI